MPPGSTPNPTANNSGWTIEYQQPATEINGAGRAVKGMRIGFVTGRGVHADVFSSWADYSPENVRAMIQAKVSQIDAVHALQG